MNIKLSQKLDAIPSVYEVYTGTDSVRQTPILIYIIQNAFQDTILRLIEIESSLLLKPIAHYFVGTDYYLVFDRPSLPTLSEFLAEKEFSEEFAWTILKQLVRILCGFQKKALVLNIFDPDFIYYNEQSAEILFASIQAVTDADDETKLCFLNKNYDQDIFDVKLPHQADVLSLGAMLLKLAVTSVASDSSSAQSNPAVKPLQQQASALRKKSLPKYADILELQGLVKASQRSQPFNDLLAAMLIRSPRHRICPEILLEHPILFTQENKKTIINFAARNYAFKLEDFRIDKQLGEGAFGICELAVFIQTGEKVVLKQTMHKQSADVEADVMTRMYHPNCCQLYGSFRNQKHYYLIIQYCEQGDLFQFITDPLRNRLLDEQKWQWIGQLSSALWYLHMNSFVHRDIKPQNILLSHDKLLLADFGVSKQTETGTETVVGTPLYFSPEQFFYKPYTSASDVFAMGFVFINIILGCHPFRNTKQDIARFFTQLQQNGNCDTFCMKIKDPQLQEIVRSMLVFDPEKRITTEALCQNPRVMQYIKLQNLPGPRVCSFFVNSRIVQSNFDFPLIYKEIQQMASKALLKYQELLPHMGKYRAIASVLLPRFTYTAFLRKHPQARSTFLEYFCLQLLEEHLNESVVQIQKKQTVSFQTDSIIVQISPVVAEFEPCNDDIEMVLITPAVLLKTTQELEFQNLVLCATKLISEQQQGVQMNIKAKHTSLIFGELFGPKPQLINKKFKGAIDIFGPHGDIDIKFTSPVVGPLTDVPTDLKLFLKLVFVAFEERFKKNCFDDEENEWLDDLIK